MTPEPVADVLGLVQHVLERQPEQGGDHRQQGDEQVVAGVAQGDPRREAGQEGGGAQELLADHVGHHGREHDGEDGLDGELPQDDLDPEEHARDGSVEGGRNAASGAAGDQDPQPALGHPDQLAQAGGQRRADLHDRALPADRAAGADAQGRGRGLDHSYLRADAPAVLGHRHHHLGHAVAAGLAGEPVDERAVDEPADDRDDHEETQAQPGKMGAGDPALLAELDVAGGGPGKKVDQVAEPDGAQPRPGAYHQGHPEQPASRAPQPAARPAGPRPCLRPGDRHRLGGHGRPCGLLARTSFGFVAVAAAGSPPAGPSGHSLSGTSPAAAANASRATATAHCCSPGSLPKMAANNTRRRAVAWSTTSRPAGVMETCTTRRSARARCRRTRPLRASRSHIRPAVDGVTSSNPARSTIRCGPRDATTTNARYWAMVVSSAAAPSDLVATATRARLAVSTASTVLSSTTCSGIALTSYPCLLQLVYSDVISDAHKELPSEAGDGVKEDDEGDEQHEKRLNRTISTFEAAMLAFVAVLAAWSGYAAAKWSTESSLLLATASADRAEANAASLDAVNALNFDATTFNDWFTAYVGGDRSAMAIAQNRFTPNLDAAFRAWLATGPETNPAAPPGPTYMPEYHQPQKAKAAKLNAQATVDYAAGEKAGSNADDYVRTTVYLATVLFLAGIGSHERAGQGCAIRLCAL